MNSKKVREQVDLAPYSWFKVGGKAKYFVELNSSEDYSFLSSIINNLQVDDVFVIGAGSNILISDSGFDGLVIKVNWSDWSLEKELWMISAGARLPVVARDIIKRGYSGMEHLANIPGTVGGAIRGNAEAFHQSMSDYITEIIWVDFERGEKVFSKDESHFAYRTSIFKEELAGQGLIKQAYFEFPKGDADSLLKIVEQDKQDRTNKQPGDLSCGCFFKNIFLDQENYQLIEKKFGREVLTSRKVGDMYASAKVIDMLGLKGLRVGGASVSDIHANFIINDQRAKAQDIFDLYRLVLQKVESDTGIILEPEVQFCGEFNK